MIAVNAVSLVVNLKKYYFNNFKFIEIKKEIKMKNGALGMGPIPIFLINVFLILKAI